MSANPRIVLNDTWVGPATTFQPGSFFVRHGTVVDITPGSALEQEYGGPANLAPLPASQSGDDTIADHAALGN